MPKFYFHTRDGHCLKDEEGEDLADRDAAYTVGVKVMSEMLPLKAADLRVDPCFEVVVTDHDREVVYTIKTTVEPQDHPV